MNRREFVVAAAALPVAAAAAPFATARRLGGTPVALVTADTEESIVAVDLSTGRVYRRLATMTGPRSVESAAGRMAIVAHTDEGAVSFVDGPSLRVTRVLRSLAEPRYAAASPDSRHAYVTDSARAELVTLDLVRRRVVHRLEVGGPARHVSLDPTGRLLWTALGNTAELVAVVDVSDPATPRLVRRFRTPFLAHDVGFGPGGRRVWVTSGDRAAIAVYHPRTLRVVTLLGADAPPQHVTFAGGRAFVTSGGSGTLRVHSLQTGRVLRTSSVPRGSFNVQEGWGRILTPSLEAGTLCVFDEAGRLVSRLRAARSSHDAAFVFSR
jgi:DNA-binding beta-propeller fold protein YncE